MRAARRALIRVRKAVDFTVMVDALPRKREGLAVATAGLVPAAGVEAARGVLLPAAVAKVVAVAGETPVVPGTRPTVAVDAPGPVTVVKITWGTV
jgi:hypothetical protein